MFTKIITNNEEKNYREWVESIASTVASNIARIGDNKLGILW